MLSRFFALILAVGLVAGAVTLRNRWDGAAADVGGQTAGTLLCVTELATVCEVLAERSEGDLEVAVQEAGDTLAALGTTDTPEFDAWLTLQPWPQMARDRREAAGLPALLGPDSDALARSPMVLGVWADRLAALENHCRTVSWACVGDVAGGDWADVGAPEAWGPVKPGLRDPARSASGLLALYQAVASKVGGADVSARDLDDVFGWLTTVARAVPESPSVGSPMRVMVQFGRGRYDVVGVIEAEATALLNEAAGRAEDLEVIRPTPAVAAEVVVVPLGADEGVARRVAAEAPATLSAEGWTLPDAEAAEVPAPGSLEALRRHWSEVM